MMRKQKNLALFIAIFSFLAKPFFSQEKAMPLREIDRIIDDPNERNFQQALVELNKYLDENPAEFDAVQRRYRKIMSSRKLYSELANELVELIKNSSEEDTEIVDERIKRITQQILALEFNPNDRRLDIVKDTNYLVSIRQYSAIQNKTARLVQTGNFSEAVKKAAEGFGILHENFIAEFGKEKASAEIDSEIKEIKKNLELFDGILARLENARSSCVNAIESENTAALQSAAQNVRSIFSEYASLRNSVAESGFAMERSSVAVKKLAEKNTKSKKTGEDENSAGHGKEYPGLACGTVFGWSEISGADHGILGAMDGAFNVNVEMMKSSFTEVLNRLAVRFAERSSVQNFRQSKILPEKSELLKIEEIGKKAREINSLYSLLMNRSGNGNQIPFPNFDISVEYLEKLALYSENFVDEAIKIAEIKASADEIKQPENPGDSALSGDSYIQSLLEVAAEINSVKNQVTANSPEKSDWSEKYRTLLEKQNSFAAENVLPQKQTDGIQIEDKILVWEEIGETCGEYIFALNDYCFEIIGGLYGRGAEFYSLAGVQYESDAFESQEKILQNLAGTIADGMKRRFSRAAAREISALEKFIADGKKTLYSGLEKISAPYEKNCENSIVSIKSSISRLDSIYDEIKKSLAEANSLIKNSDKNILEGDKKYETAQKLFHQRKFDEARAAANDSFEFYDTSLRFDYDKILAENSRKKIEKLLGEISEEQKIVIDREVNELIAQAGKQFNNDNYAEAQVLLNRAEERWNVVFLDYENTEIQNMMKIVENALNANNGREVLPSDSLYRDVSQMLRSAKQSFEKGKSFAKSGKSAEASAQFGEALQTLEILRSLVPRNMAANKLRLEIQQFQDPAQFEINFANRVSQAKETAAQAAKDSSGGEKLLQAYSELSDLAEINPNYPGLKNTILEIEYSLGKKKRPLAPGVKKQAEQLAMEAQKLFQSGNYQEAFKKINKAISTDNENQSFKTLRTKISARLKTNVYTRDSNYADRYQEIVEFISSNRYEMAQEIISEMWKNPANRTDNLTKLKNRVERALGK